MIQDRDRALKIAEFLLQIKAVKLQPKNPFTWASGLSSPIYCDNRVTLSYPAIRTYIRQGYAEAIMKEYGKPDFIAGVATGGIAQGALVAQELGIPFVYVRSAYKGHGLGNQIEGHFEKGQRVVVIEDLISTGGSSLVAVNALRDAGCEVRGLVSIFTYGFDVSIRNFADADCPFLSLTDYEHLIDQAVKENYITEQDIQSLKDWKKDPSSWKPE